MLFADWEVRIVKNCDRGLEKKNEEKKIHRKKLRQALL